MLPMNPSPVYNLALPSNKSRLTYRPFLVKEEKSLLIAQESKEDDVIIETIKNVVKACLVDCKTPVETMPTFDVEYIFLKLREVSIGERVRLAFFCTEDHGERREETKVIREINLKDVKVRVGDGHNPIIKLFDDVSIRMKYPSFDTLKAIDTRMDKVASEFALTVACIEGIYDGDTRHDPADQTQEELMEFLEKLSGDQFAKIQHFFKTSPRLYLEVEQYTCPLCTKIHKPVLEGLKSFF